MLKPEEMSKLTVIGPKSLSYNVINRLHKLKVYHIVNHRKSENLDIGSPLEDSEVISELLVKIRAICSFLNISPERGRPGKILNITSAKNKIGGLDDSVKKKLSQAKDLDGKIKASKERRDIIDKIAALNLNLDSFKEYGSIDYLFGLIEDTKDLPDDLRIATGRCKGCSKSFNNKNIVALFFDKKKKSEIADLLSKRGFSEIDTSFIREENLKGKASKELQKINVQIKDMEKKELLLKKDLDDIKNKWSDYLIETEKTLSAESEKAEAPLRFGATEEVFVVNGWVPSRKLEKVKKEIESAAENKIFITSEKAKEDEKIPIKLKNPNIAKPFEWFMDLYTLPRYEEIDPTFLMFLTFPLFYGFMLGDVGYGLVTLALFLILRTRVGKDFARLVNAMIFGSISAIIFGILFAEYFGVELYAPILINRLHDTQGLLIMAVAIGAVHVNIGLFVGFYNELRAHGLKAAIFEKLSWIVLELGAVALALSYMDGLGLRPLPWVGYTILAIAVAMIYKGEGAKGLIEIPAIFSHMLSYARLMAVGLASVILAFVINDLAGDLFAAGIAGIFGGVLLLVVGHAINIGLGLISPFLHSLRLHYVEFFTKFYHGGGMRYVPFGTERELE